MVELLPTASVLLRNSPEVVMRYFVAWLLGVPFTVIVIWYLVGHAACGH